jgi:hypothetical protein
MNNQPVFLVGVDHNVLYHMIESQLQTAMRLNANRVQYTSHIKENSKHSIFQPSKLFSSDTVFSKHESSLTEASLTVVSSSGITNTQGETTVSYSISFTIAESNLMSIYRLHYCALAYTSSSDRGKKDWN